MRAPDLDPELVRLEEDLRAIAPQADPAFLAALQQRVAAGFPRPERLPATGGPRRQRSPEGRRPTGRRGDATLDACTSSPRATVGRRDPTASVTGWKRLSQNVRMGQP